MTTTWRWYLALGVALALLGRADGAAAARYKVTVTDLTRGQHFSPFYVAVHRSTLPKVFAAGRAASPELEALAEGGDVNPLADLLKSGPDLLTHSFGAAVPPGGSSSVEVDKAGDFNRITLVSMLVPTNDAFIGLDNKRLPSDTTPAVHFLEAYDAGTEANDELCAHIPGPAGVCQGAGFDASREGAEGVVLVHAGIHGIGDLVPADRDWRNPVARITVRRIL